MKLLKSGGLFSSSSSAAASGANGGSPFVTDQDSVSQRGRAAAATRNGNENGNGNGNAANSSGSSSMISAATAAAATITSTATLATASSKFHRAALDGYIDMLCDASRRDTNLVADQAEGFTPTLLAAHSGQLEALRILVGRGGDPERTTSAGSSALHLAAARGHLNCVSFLVNFGANMWALDNELHTAKDVAAIGQRQEVLNYLDQMMAKQSALNTRSVQKLKEKAKLSLEKRLKQMRKAQLKAIKQIERDERYLARLSNNRRLLKSAQSISDIKLVCKSPPPQPPPPSSASSSVGSSSTAGSSSDKSSLYSSSLILNSPIGSLLAAANRHSSAASSSSSRCSSSANLINSQFKLRPRPAASNNCCPDDGGGGSSSSPLSALAAAATPFFFQAPKYSTRPKYSELVAMRLKDDHQQQQHQPIRPHSSTNNLAIQTSVKSNNSCSSSGSSSSSSSIGNKLSKGLGGVSRRVQLRKFLQIGAAAASSTSDLTSCGLQVESNPAGGCRSQAATKTTGKQQGSIRWPPAPTLSRATSEPDFMAQQLAAAAAAAAANGDPLSAKTSTKAAAAPPPPTTPKVQPINGSKQVAAARVEEPTSARPLKEEAKPRDETQHRLLTQCLNQLKLCHHENNPTATGNKQPPNQMHAKQQQQQQQQPQPSTESPLMRPVADSSGGELTQGNGGGRAGGHQQPQAVSSCGGDAEFETYQIMRPSVIKQQQQRKQQPPAAGGAGQCRVPTVGSIDSIGSAGSLADRDRNRNRSSAASSSVVSFATSNSTESSSCGTSSQESSGGRTSQQPAPPSINRGLAPNSFIIREETMDSFLASSGLLDLSEVFARERIDLEALMLLSEDDLKSLKILLGPRRKLLKAIETRRNSCEAKLNKCNPSSSYLMVDTSL